MHALCMAGRAIATCTASYALVQHKRRAWWRVMQIKVLGGSPYEWLGEMLAAFNHGDLHAYDALCERHAGALNAQPALVAHERALREKITILCLMELIFKCAAAARGLNTGGLPHGLYTHAGTCCIGVVLRPDGRLLPEGVARECAAC